MSTQQVRNLINNQIDSVIARAETDIRSEAKKKLVELKQKVPTPEEVIKKLEAEITPDSCSPGGVEKFYKIHEQISGKLTTIEYVLTRGLDKLITIDEKIKPIVSGDGPVGKINQMVETLKPLTDIFKSIISLAPILLAANSGPASSGAVTDQVSTRRNKAESKVKEYIALFMVIPSMITFYTNKAQVALNALNSAVDKLTYLKEEILKLKLLLAALIKNFEDGCDQLLSAGNTSAEFNDTSGGQTTNTDPLDNFDANSELNDYLSFLQQEYDDLYQQLVASGNEKAIKRVFKIKESLEKGDYIGYYKINL